MFERATINPEHASSILPKPENFYLVTSLELRLYYPTKLNLGTPALKPEKFLTDRKSKRVQGRRLSCHETETPVSTQSTFSMNMKAVLCMELNKLCYATHNLIMHLD